MKLIGILTTTVTVLLTSLIWAQETPPGATESPEGIALYAAASNADVPLGRPLEWTAPKYPKDALKHKTEDDVALALSVDDKGRVVGVSPIGGKPEFVEAATRTVQKWRYVPYYQEGKAIPVTTTVSLRFKVNDAGKPDINVGYKARPIGPVLKVGNGVLAPKAIYAPEAEYSREAKKKRLEGTCALSLIVGPDGGVYDIRVSKSLGSGLDEESIKTVKQWRFQPATKGGEPVAVSVIVELAFHL